MRAIAQYSIHSLNDVVTGTSSPSSPYKGQLWVNTSYSPPRIYTYNGSSWVETNGVATIRSNVSTLTTNYNNLSTNLNGLTSEVGVVSKLVDEQGETIATLSSDVSTLQQTDTSISARVTTNQTNISSLTVSVSSIQTRMTTAEGNISSLTQTANSLSAQVSGKVDETYGSSASSFGWQLKSTGFYVYSAASTVVSITSSGLSVVGAIDATSGSIGNLTIDGYLRFGGNTSYYISANYSDSNYYINLPGFRVDNASSAVFSGRLSAPSGTIGGFTISTSKIYKTKTTYSDSNTGVYIGTDGIGLGAGTFYVTSAGFLHATNADITGTINCSSGTIGGFTIGASSLTNSSGGSYIEIQSGNYTTKFSASSIYSSYSSGSDSQGWSISNSQIAISSKTSSVYCGIKILPYYTKRTSSSAYSSTTVAEGCITSYKSTYYNADQGTTTWSGSPFIIGMYREYADSPYVPFKEWGAYLRFASHQTAELVYDSAYSGTWQLRNVSGSTYNIVTLLQHVNAHKFYFWTYTSSVANDSRVSITYSTHGLSTVSGAIVIPREKSLYGQSSSLSGDKNLVNGISNYGVYITGTTVYVICDTSTLANGFFCLIYGS